MPSEANRARSSPVVAGPGELVERTIADAVQRAFDASPDL
jgi:hypothetical protein